MIIDVGPDTSPEEAILMAHSFALSLRKTGWQLSDEDYARSLWIEREYHDNRLLAFLLAGFIAGYHLEEKPTVTEVRLATLPETATNPGSTKPMPPAPPVQGKSSR